MNQESINLGKALFNAFQSHTQRHPLKSASYIEEEIKRCWNEIVNHRLNPSGVYLFQSVALVLASERLGSLLSTPEQVVSLKNAGNSIITNINQLTGVDPVNSGLAYDIGLFCPGAEKPSVWRKSP